MFLQLEFLEVLECSNLRVICNQKGRLELNRFMLNLMEIQYSKHPLAGLVATLQSRLFILQKFAFKAHPLKQTLMCITPHCRYVYKIKLNGTKQYASASALYSGQQEQKEFSTCTTTATNTIQTSELIAIIEWVRMASLMASSAEMYHIIATHSENWSHDSDTHMDSLLSTSNVSSRISSANSVNQWTGGLEDSRH